MEKYKIFWGLGFLLGMVYLTWGYLIGYYPEQEPFLWGIAVVAAVLIFVGFKMKDNSDS